jgi:hypothetical protein
MSNPKDLVGAKKAPMDLVPAAGAIMSAPAHENGMRKYGAFNWRENPVQLMTYLGAIRRHMDAFIDGQDLAEDTGIHHLSHMLAGMNIIADALALGNLIDNRPPKGPAADMLRALDKSVKLQVPTYTESEREQWLRTFFESTARPDMYDVRPVTRDEVDQWLRDPGESQRPALCTCPAERARYGDHLMTCPHWGLGGEG